MCLAYDQLLLNYIKKFINIYKIFINNSVIFIIRYPPAGYIEIRYIEDN